LPARLVFFRVQVNGPVITTPERCGAATILEARDLRSLAVGAAKIMRELSTVAVLDGDEKPFAIVGALQLRLGDSRKLFAENINILFVRRAKLVKVNLLIKLQIFLRPLTGRRIARVEEPRAVAVPGRVAPRGGEDHPRYHVTQLLAGFDVKEIERS